MKLKFTNDGLVEGCVECGFWSNDNFEAVEVSDLVGWLKAQFLLLQEIYEVAPSVGKNKRSVVRIIYLGGDETPFGALEVGRSKFKIYFFHPQILGLFESSDVEKTVSHITREAMKVSDFNWTGMIPKFGNSN